MADRGDRYQPLHYQRPVDGIRHTQHQKGVSTSQILALVTVVPLGGFLLFLAGITLVGTLIGLAVTTPLFIICSPVLVPAALVIGLALMGFLTSGAFGVTALSSLSWLVNYFRRVPEQLEHAKKWGQEAAGQVGQKAREAGQTVQGKAQEVGRGGQDQAGKAVHETGIKA